MPLFQATYLSNTRHFVPIFYGFVGNEQTDSYNWLIECMAAAREEYDIQLPDVITVTSRMLCGLLPPRIYRKQNDKSASFASM